MSHYAIDVQKAPPGLTETEDAERFRKALRATRAELLTRLLNAAATSLDPAVRAASAALAQLDAVIAAMQPPPRDDDGDDEY